MNASTRALKWRYDDGVIINPTITIAGDQAFFIESIAQPERIDPFDDESERCDRNHHDREHEVNIVAQLNIGVWNFAATWVYASGKAYTAPESQYFLEMLDSEMVSYIHVSDKNANRLPDYRFLVVLKPCFCPYK